MTAEVWNFTLPDSRYSETAMGLYNSNSGYGGTKAILEYNGVQFKDGDVAEESKPLAKKILKGYHEYLLSHGVNTYEIPRWLIDDDPREAAYEIGDEELIQESEELLKKLEKSLDKFDFQKMLSGEYDSADAILTVNSGAGGTDAQDWTSMLLRMYTRWAENKNWKVELLDKSDGEEAGIKSATIKISGKYIVNYDENGQISSIEENLAGDFYINGRKYQRLLVIVGI